MKWLKWLLPLCLALLLLANCGKDSDYNSREELRKMAKFCGMDTASAVILEGMDSHGGFQGDGTSYLKLQFSQPPELGEGWKELPMSENVATLCYGIENEYGHFGPYIEAGLIPEIENGYYLFYDRHSESGDPYDDSGVLKRPSYNFIVAVYDTDNNQMYYVKHDT